MAIRVGTNALTSFRYHGARCERQLKRGKWTYAPHTPEEKKADALCNCPIWTYGYLANETQTVNGKIKPLRINPLSLGTSDWAKATQRVAELYRLGKVPRNSISISQQVDRGIATVNHAAKRFDDSNKQEVEKGNIGEVTYQGYSNFVNQRLLPWCADNGISSIKDFERSAVCDDFVKSWRRLKQDKNAAKPLAASTEKHLKDIFCIFLRFCLRKELIAKEGTQTYEKRLGQARTVRVYGDEQGKRYGLELIEFSRLMATGNPNLTQQEVEETKAAIALMRYVGLRVSDCHKFNSSEIVRNEVGDGFNADFLQKKVKGPSKRCISPIPTGSGVREMLEALPGRIRDGKKFYFTCSVADLRHRIAALAERAQRDGLGAFAHHFTPHCLRHTFAIQLLNRGVDIRLISKWLGHSSEVVTRKHYQHWIKSTTVMAEHKSQEAYRSMLKEVYETEALINARIEVMKEDRSDYYRLRARALEIAAAMGLKFKN